MEWMNWYNALAKPAWTPSPDTIRTIWAMLYPVIAFTFGFVFIKAGRGRMPGRVAWPYALNLLANLAFMPILAGLQYLDLASADIVLVWLTLLWAAAAVWPHARWVACAQIPYFVWVSIAMFLQLSITAMNWPAQYRG